MDKITKLDFVVVGVQKSATTWIYECLKNHPEISLKNNKYEINYFGGENFRKLGESWFWNQFDNSAKVKGDVSVEYIKDKEALKELKENFTDVKVILCLRNPVERAISAFYWYQRKSLVTSEPIEQQFEDALCNRTDNAKLKDILDRGKYSDQVQFLLDHFEHNQIGICLYDELSISPDIFLHNIFKFIDLADQSYRPSVINRRPKKTSSSNLILKFQRLFPNSKVTFKLAEILTNILEKKGNDYEQLSKLKSSLREYYYKDLETLRKQLVKHKGVLLSEIEYLNKW
ncbi:MAG: sulfotransferase domain-containing protein [Reichenbachiella sp.]